ncbi:hypothetical protein Ga0074812_10443 [Parafrankia irregularis]|uniref:Uncharacterized protein n=2 Tax=Parafrankia TaxID=2994362 RepID=A0A0S4QHP6_9ACTN|nr:hypothetical protein [Parafrankia irregularis]MBE3204161.1 hypothetical protein [Parafrankia sp. CH37]CUU54963.1 hypothetical protein Ga0074812_10443 [Parafrankia irregularis]
MCQITVRSPSDRFRTLFDAVYLGVDECQITVRCGVASWEPTEHRLQKWETSILLRDTDNAPASSLDRPEIVLALTESQGGSGVNGADTPTRADRWFGPRETRAEVTGPRTLLAARSATGEFLPRSWEPNACKAEEVGMVIPALCHSAATPAPSCRGDIADLGEEIPIGFSDVFASLPAAQAAERKVISPRCGRLPKVHHSRGAALAQVPASVRPPSGGDVPLPSGGPSAGGSDERPEQDTALTAVDRLLIDQADTAASRVTTNRHTRVLEAGRGLRLAPVGGGQ